jgi:hypothetical protein
MQTSPAHRSQSLGESGPGGSRTSFADAARFWEHGRLIYNAVLGAVVAVWVIATWPHFRPVLTLSSVLLLSVLALLANLCYCAAYLVDIPMQRFSHMRSWGRRGLWFLGMLFAVVLANYWIADEIYPFVR